ncbi:hypothetical protein FQN57_000761 [Myotisia sp. PD_48]|nr:hypothetical protein FQN57_000761 [Myotisia sp. PD_48]
MTSAPSSGSGGAQGPPTFYPAMPNISPVPRRSSYASVVSGVAASPAMNTPASPSPWSSFNPMNPTPSNSYPPQYATTDPRLHRFALGATDSEMQANGNWYRRGLATLPSFSRRFEKYFDRTGLLASANGLANHDDKFFTPSYLKSSKYVAQLAAASRAKFPAAQKEASSSSSLHTPNPPSLSASSSNVNLHRMAPSHRGMTYDIIEHQPPPADEPLTPLPSRWNEADKYEGLDLLNDGMEVRYVGPTNKHEHEAAAVRADYPMPPQCGIYYFEITILAKQKEGMIAIGFSNSQALLERLPGWEPESWAYHGDDGKTFFGDNQRQGKSYGPTFTVSDTIGCGVNFATGCAFFTKNGSFIGYAFRDLKLNKVFPAIGMKKQPGAHIKSNFGQQPFMFDIDSMMKSEKITVQMDVQSTAISALHPLSTETEFMHQLISQYLAHDGYVETARAFFTEIQDETRALQSIGQTPMKEGELKDDIDAINRQKIRAAILEGDIDQALTLTNTHFPNVLAKNPHVHFQLRCRKFIEMMRRCTEPQTTRSPPQQSRHSNGLPHKTGGEMFSGDMELDEQLEDGLDGEDMDAEDQNNITKDQNLLHEAIAYGQQLQVDFPGDEQKDYKQTLADIFSLVAYPDPKTSVHGHLLDPSGRIAVVEELNAAILVSLGKPRTTILERLIQQTEVLVGESTDEGGAGAFINVEEDYLRQ